MEKKKNVKKHSRKETVTHLYTGGGFDLASHCSITFFSVEFSGKIASSGSWIKTGPNSSLSVWEKKEFNYSDALFDHFYLGV